jgi:excisionase family DNA binding protein
MAQLLPDPALEPTLSVDRVSAILGLNKRTVYNAIERGDIPAIKLNHGRAIRIPTARFLEAFQLTTAPAV